MRPEERRHLKEDLFVSNTARVFESFTLQRDRWIKAGGAVLLLLVVAGAFAWWQKSRAEAGGAELGIALGIEQATIVPAPAVPGATQAAGTYPTERAKKEAALKAFEQVAAKYGASKAGLTARYHVGVTQLGLGRYTDAQKTFEDVASRAGGSVYGAMARMGRAEALLSAGTYDEAIKAFTELSAERDGLLPIDGVLMQLARTCAKAGKTQEAKANFKRVVDEFPESPYAAEARQELALLG
jgi:TolA-binding protein